LLLKFPSADSIAILERYHVKYVVVHPQWYLQYESPVMMAEMLAQMQANTKLHLLTTFGNNIATSDSVWQVL
jgi:ActR/RegA family two-component response regulator